MKSWTLRFLLGLVCFVLPSLVYSQAIQVSLPEMAIGQVGSSVTIPINVTDLTNRNVLFYQGVILFDKDVLKATGASSTGTLSQPFGEPTVDITVEGEIIVGGLGSSPLSGSGVLVNLEFNVVGNPGEMTDLRFAGFIFNTGLPPVNTVSGMFTVAFPLQPDIRVEPASHDFGEVFLNSSAVQSFTILNEGQVSLNVLETNLIGANSDQFVLISGQAPFSLEPGSSQNSTIRFSPTSIGMKSAVFEIISNDPEQDTLMISLSGIGLAVPEPDIAVEPLNIDFGNVAVNTMAVQSLKIFNEGQGDLVIESTDFSGSDSSQFLIRGRTPPFTIAPNDSNEFDIGFEPQSAGQKEAMLQIVSNDPDEDTIVVAVAGMGVDAIEITAQILTPLDGDFVCGDSVLVRVGFEVAGGIEPFEINCEVNGVMGTQADSVFLVEVPVVAGRNSLVAICNVVDAIGQTDNASTAIEVFKNPPPLAKVDILSPPQDTFICADKIEISASIVVQNGTPPFSIICDVNGNVIEPTDKVFSTMVALVPGDNEIIVSCTVVDDCGLQSIARDTLNVFSDPTPPVCDLDFDDFPTIRGRLSDFESGIARFEVVEIRNRTFSIDSFDVGAPVVNFVLEKINPNESATFTIRVENRAGCFVICDPIDVTLSPANASCYFAFSVPKKERYLYINNHGLSRIRARINQSQFHFVTTDIQSGNENLQFQMPLNGAISFDIVELLTDGQNAVTLECEGPEGSFANVLITDIRLGDDIRLLPDGAGLPEEFALAQNFPNPFNPTTEIEYNIPENSSEGISVQLRVYNLLGKLVKVLVDEQKQPGHYRTIWDGRNETGQEVSTGIYLYQLQAADFRQTRRMLLIR